jgi:hypothetical protein
MSKLSSPPITLAVLGYMDVTEGSRAIMGYSVCVVHGRHRGLQGQAGVPSWVNGRHRGLQGQVGVLSVSTLNLAQDPS